MYEPLRSALTSADPLQTAEDPRTRELVRHMAVQARSATETMPATVPWWKRRRAVIPLGFGAGVALTGGALLAPLTIFIDGITVDPDARIPIVYTTDTGTEVNCRYAIYFGDPANRSETEEKLATFVADHRWDGFGQKVYKLALSDPFVPGVDGGLDVDTQQRRDEMSLFTAIYRSIDAEIPPELRDLQDAEGVLDSGSSDCQGQLH